MSKRPPGVTMTDEKCRSKTCAVDHFRWWLNIAAKGEPTFTLRAQDKVAVATVRAWLDLAAMAGASKEKLAGATETAINITSWQLRNGCKVPD